MQKLLNCHIKSSSAIALTSITLVAITLLLPARCAAGRRVHKRFIIHVPFRIKTHHHTHTVYSHIHSGGSSGATKQTIYKILGYSMHGGNVGAYGHGGYDTHGHGHGNSGHGHTGHVNGHGHRHGEINMYDMDTHGCDGHNQGDMIFNHYARNDDDYPDMEEFIDEEQGDDEWE